ncbi:hypothetical protein [Bordetella sp. LUAb4]|uniref:phage tail assembly chaperone n=1 Tax=Bordetella sp. LUAb4 TaxID=2843195 RepID=UPI001E40377E|nr:hypothetical protein [Bordetella sp. LUAb4]
MYEAIEQQTGVRAALLDGPALPREAAHVWQWFEDLSAHRQLLHIPGAIMPQPVGYTDMAHYFSLAGIAPQPWQRRLLSLLDRLYRRTVIQRPAQDSAAQAGALRRRQRGRD